MTIIYVKIKRDSKLAKTGLIIHHPFFGSFSRKTAYLRTITTHKMLKPLKLVGIKLNLSQEVLYKCEYVLRFNLEKICFGKMFCKILERKWCQPSFFPIYFGFIFLIKVEQYMFLNFNILCCLHLIIILFMEISFFSLDDISFFLCLSNRKEVLCVS